MHSNRSDNLNKFLIGSSSEADEVIKLLNKHGLTNSFVKVDQNSGATYVDTTNTNLTVRRRIAVPDSKLMHEESHKAIDYFVHVHELYFDNTLIAKTIETPKRTKVELMLVTDDLPSSLVKETATSSLTQSLSSAIGLKSSADELFKVQLFKEKIGRAIADLRDKSLNTQENIEFVESFPEFAGEMAAGITILEDYKALTQRNRLRLSAYPKHSYEIAHGLGILTRSNQDTQDNWCLLCAFPAYAGKIAGCIGSLNSMKMLSEYKSKLYSVIEYKRDRVDMLNFSNAIAILEQQIRLLKSTSDPQKYLDELFAHPEQAAQIIASIYSASSSPRP